MPRIAEIGIETYIVGGYNYSILNDGVASMEEQGWQRIGNEIMVDWPEAPYGDKCFYQIMWKTDFKGAVELK